VVADTADNGQRVLHENFGHSALTAPHRGTASIFFDG
jgi:hypothetical protein